MAIEIVDFPIKNGDFPSFFVCLPEGTILVADYNYSGDANNKPPNESTRIYLSIWAWHSEDRTRSLVETGRLWVNRMGLTIIMCTFLAKNSFLLRIANQLFFS